MRVDRRTVSGEMVGFRLSRGGIQSENSLWKDSIKPSHWSYARDEIQAFVSSLGG